MEYVFTEAPQESMSSSAHSSRCDLTMTCPSVKATMQCGAHRSYMHASHDVRAHALKVPDVAMLFGSGVSLSALLEDFTQDTGVAFCRPRRGDLRNGYDKVPGGSLEWIQL